MKEHINLVVALMQMHRPSFSDTSWIHPLIDVRLPPGASKVEDAYGNVFVLVGDSEQSDVAFTCHMDTVARPKSKPPVVSINALGMAYVSNPWEADCLGADDAAGIAVLLTMLEHAVHGRYCFFKDEEAGCYGSSHSAKDKTGFWTGVKAMISFDRRGDDVVVAQRGSACCSNEFAMELAHRLGRDSSKIKAGIYTDSAEFVHLVPECTNIGVGYQNEHTSEEVLDLLIFDKLVHHCIAPGTFQDLPIKRVPEPYSGWDMLTSAYPEDEDPDLLSMFRELSQLSKPELIRWILDNPERAAVYIMIYSDYGFRGETIELGTKVIQDWGGIEQIAS